MRSSLRWAWLPVVLLAVPAAASAQADASAVARFNECAAITTDQERLACFDRVTRDVRASAAPAVSAPAQTPGRPANREALARTERENFGLDARQQEARRPSNADRARPIKKVIAKAVAAKRYDPGYWAILLEDGAIWEVTELNREFRGPRPGETVQIRRGLMGGYLLDVGSQPSIRVQRVS